MKFTVFLMLWAFILTLVGVCPPVAASLWTSGQVVYTTNYYRNRDIVLMGPNGEHIRYLTDSTDDEFEPDLSPSGTEVLYTRQTRWGNKEIWIVETDGSNQRRLIDGEHPEFGAHPGYFFARDGDHNLSGFRLRHREGRTDVWHRETIVTGGNPAYPAWARTEGGHYLAYVAGGTSDEPWNGASLYVYDARTRSSTKIVSGVPGYGMSRPAWGLAVSSRDRSVLQGRAIAFAWKTVAGARTICSVRVDGSDLRVLWVPTDGSWLGHPTVAPFGGELIVTRHFPSSRDTSLYKVTLRTNNWQRIGLSGSSGSIAEYNTGADWWHLSSFPVEPGALQLTTTWGDLKKKAR